jgi:hypothetical protein
MDISTDIKLLIEAVNDYKNNEDYKNSKKLSTGIGTTFGAAGGAGQMFNAAKALDQDNVHTAAATLGGAALGGAISGVAARIQGHYMGKEMAKDPNHPIKSAILGSMKANLKIGVPLAATIGAIGGGLLAHHDGVDAAMIANKAIQHGALWAAAQGAYGTAASVPFGAAHGAIVKRMRKNK